MSQVRKLETRGFPERTIVNVLAPLLDGNICAVSKMRADRVLGVLEMTEEEMRDFRWHFYGGD